MIALPVDPTAPRLVGNDAGWQLVFFEEGEDGQIGKRVLSCGRADYYASIQASMPGGLDGGSYTFAIEGMTNEHYTLLTPHRGRLAVKLYLYWRDTSSAAGRAANLAGLTDVVDRFPAGRGRQAVARRGPRSRCCGAGRRAPLRSRRRSARVGHDRLTHRLTSSTPPAIGPLPTARPLRALLDPAAPSAYAEIAPTERSTPPRRSRRTAEKLRTGVEHLVELDGDRNQRRDRFGLDVSHPRRASCTSVRAVSSCPASPGSDARQRPHRNPSERNRCSRIRRSTLRPQAPGRRRRHAISSRGR